MEDTPAVPSFDAERFRLGSESELAFRLKWEAWERLYSEARCRSIGLEVRLQGPWGSVVDVVGVGPGNTIYAVEVKASRADFARDNHGDAHIGHLRRRADALDRRIELANSPGYRSANGDLGRLEREAQRLRERLATVSTKFHDPRFLGIADFHHIMAPRGVVLTEMVPPGWGLLEPGPREVVEAPSKAIRKNTGIVSNVLRAIARANTAAMMRAYGVRYGAAGAVFPNAGNHAVNPVATDASAIATTTTALHAEEGHARYSYRPADNRPSDPGHAERVGQGRCHARPAPDGQ